MGRGGARTSGLHVGVDGGVEDADTVGLPFGGVAAILSAFWGWRDPTAFINPTKRRHNHEASHSLSRGGGGVGGHGGDVARAGRGEGGCETLHGGVRERPGARAEGALRSR